MDGIGRVRVVLALSTLCCALVLTGSFLAAADGNQVQGSASAVEEAIDNETAASVVPPRADVTVVTADSTALVDTDSRAARLGSNLVAFAPNGTILYHAADHAVYWDVDPVPGTDRTVEYVYSDHLQYPDCPTRGYCTRNGVERLNLTTGEVEPVFSRLTPNVSETRWHDVDRLDDHRLLVADIDRDRAFVVNATTNETTWEWTAATDFDTDSGGHYPTDWTHINDVEAVELDGEPTVMVSVRNHDQVVFVDPEDGLRENWTLGADDDHDVLYEQHNPDYIPAERGGPALLVADSENGRVVEYQRRNGSWVQSWQWRDERLTWPRDADRVLEVDENGTVVWSIDIGFPYEAERLGTGDESAGGPSAVRMAATEREPNATQRSAVGRAATLVPPSLVNAAAYVRPGWVGTTEAIAAVGLLVAGPLWALVEWRRLGLGLHRQWPFVARRR